MKSKTVAFSPNKTFRLIEVGDREPQLIDAMAWTEQQLGLMDIHLPVVVLRPSSFAIDGYGYYHVLQQYIAVANHQLVVANFFHEVGHAIDHQGSNEFFSDNNIETIKAVFGTSQTLDKLQRFFARSPQAKITEIVARAIEQLLVMNYPNPQLQEQWFNHAQRNGFFECGLYWDKEEYAILASNIRALLELMVKTNKDF
jgi:hypothetical protein